MAWSNTLEWWLISIFTGHVESPSLLISYINIYKSSIIFWIQSQFHIMFRPCCCLQMTPHPCQVSTGCISSGLMQPMATWQVSDRLTSCPLELLMSEATTYGNSSNGGTSLGYRNPTWEREYDMCWESTNQIRKGI